MKGHEKDFTSTAFSADGKTHAMTTEDFTCRIWKVENGRQTYRRGDIFHVIFTG